MVIFEAVENIKFLDIPLLDARDFGVLFIRYIFNLFITIMVVNLYYRFSKNKDFFFTFIAFNSLIFFMVYIMNKVNIGVGFGFGLFALFSILRYRTEAIEIKEMSYLFVVITIGVLNALISENFSYAELVAINLLIVILTYSLERVMVRQTLTSQNIIYEKIENIIPSRKDILIRDLQNRTGLVIQSIKIKNIDFLRDVVSVTLYYDKNEQPEPVQEIEEVFVNESNKEV